MKFKTRNPGVLVINCLQENNENLIKKVVRTLKGNWPIVLSNVFSLYLSICCWNPYDVRYFLIWHDKYFSQGKLLEIYTGSLEEKVAYFPLAVIIFVLSHELALRISDNIIIWRFINKIPLLLSFNIVYLILVRKYGKSAGYIWLLTFTAYSIIMAYQFDLVIVLFVLLALISLEKGNYKLYALWISLATLIKQPLALLLIVPFVDLLKKKCFRGLIEYVGTSAITLFTFIMPFLLVDPRSFLTKTIFFHTTRLPQFSMWAIPYYLTGFNPDALPTWIYNTWIIPYAIFLVWIIYRMYKKESTFTYVTFLKYVSITIAGFLVFTKVNNIPYTLWLAPSIIILVLHTVKKNHAVSERIARTYIFLNIIIISMSVLFVFPSAVTAYPIYIPEDQNWVPADKFIADSGGPYSPIYYISLYFRSITFIRDYFAVLAGICHHIVAILCIVYVTLLSYIIIKLLKHF